MSSDDKHMVIQSGLKVLALGFIIVMVVRALVNASQTPPRWQPVLAEVIDLRLIKTHVHRPESPFVYGLIQYRLSYEVDGRHYVNDVMVQHQQPALDSLLTTREAEYWLWHQERSWASPVRVWVNARNPQQMR